MSIAKDCNTPFGVNGALEEVCERCGEEVNADIECVCSTEPLWYALSDSAEKARLPQRSWEELMNLAQMLHDLEIDSTDKLMRRLGAIYCADEESTLQGKYYWALNKYNTDRFLEEDREMKPIQSNRRKAIMAQKEKKGKNDST